MDTHSLQHRILIFDASSALSVLKDTLRERWPGLKETVEEGTSSTWHYLYSDAATQSIIEELGLVPDEEDGFLSISVDPLEGEPNLSWFCVTTGSGIISECVLRVLNYFRAFWEIQVAPHERHLQRARYLLSDYLGRESPPWTLVATSPNDRDKLLDKLTSLPVEVTVTFSGEILKGLETRLEQQSS